MDIYALGLRTELGLAAASGRVLDRGSYLVVTMPDEPSFYHGNFLVLPSAPGRGELPHWTRTFADELDDPRIRHVTLRWDGVTDQVPAQDELAAAAFTIERHWVMTASELTSPRAPEGIELRPLQAAEMPAVVPLALALADRHDELYRQFLARRAVAKQRLVERGLATWWGAFDGSQLVASLGIVPLDGVVRYQDVQTAPTHRRRGIAGALVAAAAKDRGKVVIVAEPDSAAARLYGRLGFTVTERIASACRYPAV